MSGEAVPALLAVAGVCLVTLVVGGRGWWTARTTSDFYVASRAVSPAWNASAIGGEYLSAASFLGIAGLVLALGADMLWFGVGYTAGYLALLVLVAAPLRRSGAYTLPDFAEARCGSTVVRRIASALVVVVGWLYLLPQFQGAGVTLRTLVGAPVWVGVLLVAAVVLVAVVAGGMRSITFVQAFQYWLKLTALLVPLLFLLLVWRAEGSPAPDGPGPARFPRPTTVTLHADTALVVPELPTGPDAVTVRVSGELDGVARGGEAVALAAGRHEATAGTRFTFPAGAVVPHAEELPPLTGEEWALPLNAAREHPLYSTLSLALATFLGTMGLPHVVVRFYTNPDGRAARRTALTVIALLGLFYLLPPVYGWLGRIYLPELLLTGETDAGVLLLPERVVGGVGGQLLGALVAAGAFAAFLSTSSGLTVSVAGVLSQDLLGRFARGLPDRAGVAGFRLAALVAVVVPAAGALAAAELDVASVVGLAFAVAASSFCPLLLLGIWWRRLSTAGAAAGLLVGGGTSLAAVFVTLLGDARTGWVGALLTQPAAWSVPLAFVVTALVSLLTPGRVPPETARIMVRLHAPEGLGLGAGGAELHRP